MFILFFRAPTKKRNGSSMNTKGDIQNTFTSVMAQMIFFGGTSTKSRKSLLKMSPSNA